MDVALARPVTQLPTGPSWAYEIKVDGHRTVLWQTEDGVRLQSRTGRDVTALWMDLAVAAMRLSPGVILDGVMCPVGVSQPQGVSSGAAPIDET
ncbi:hypothetical protein ACIPSA_35795 [Streptomyces sp. NPDC086549]|uniref:ATP-dependent DNA ligase n=1 Tax=Streptomyces sp. NPDC086549 TaxID=3365752 RepID=UPI00382D1A4D